MVSNILHFCGFFKLYSEIFHQLSPIQVKCFLTDLSQFKISKIENITKKKKQSNEIIVLEIIHFVMASEIQILSPKSGSIFNLERTSFSLQDFGRFDMEVFFKERGVIIFQVMEAY